MDIKVESRAFRDVAVLVPDIFQDSRGFFTETYREDKFRELGLPTQFVQDNHSRSAKGVVRGLHFQWDPPMGKLDASHCGKRVFGRGRHSQRFANARQVGGGGSLGGESAAGVGSGGVCTRLLCAFGVCRDSVQVHGTLQQQGRIRHSLGRSRNRHRMAGLGIVKRSCRRRTKRRRRWPSGWPDPNLTIFVIDIAANSQKYLRKTIMKILSRRWSRLHWQRSDSADFLTEATRLTSSTCSGLATICRVKSAF